MGKPCVKDIRPYTAGYFPERSRNAWVMVGASTQMVELYAANLESRAVNSGMKIRDVNF